MSRVAIIAARGGSKRLPGKNVRPFCGRPIIEYSIDAALQARACDRVIVSTDDDAIAEVARAAGAETPFVRPDDLSGDFTPLIDVVLHAADALDPAPTAVCLILATAPFVTSRLIDEAFDMLQQTGADAAITVSHFEFPIRRAFKVDEASHRLRMEWPEHMFTRSQDLPESFFDAGQLYWLRPEALRREAKIYVDDAVPVVVPRHRVQDIDTEDDWIRAEVLFELLQRREGPT